MWYRINPSRFTYEEIRAENSWLTSVLGWLLVKLRVPLPSSSDHPAVDELEPFRIAGERVPPEVLAELSEPKEQLAALGFKGTIYYHFFDSTHRTEIHQAVYVHQSGKAIARLSRRVFSADTPPKKFIHCAFITPLTRGRTLGTANCAGGLLGPEACLDECLKDAPLDATWRRHVERMKEPEVRESIDPIASAREALTVLQKRHQAINECLIDRGVFTPLVAESAAATSSDEAPGDTPAATPDGADPMLLTEVRRLEDKQPTSWLTSLIILIGTIALFLGLGGAVWSWRFTALLIPILLFHEAGHYLAMKLFDYRNVQMFFIPLFGAAVSGRHYDVPGWKRVVTSLMGPVPGIVLGVGLGIVALVQQQDLLMEAALLLLILNGFNLLPSLPLDGGWVMHGLLFSRHAFLDLLSRLFGIAVLLFLAFAGGAKLMMYLGIAMAVGLPMSFNLARITDRLRAADKPLGPPRDGHAPASAVERIAAEIDEAYPKGLDVRAKSKLVLQVYENVNSKPPGVLATLTLGSVYLGSLLTACVAGAVFVVAQHGDLGQLMRDAAFGPQVIVRSEELQPHPSDFTAADAAWPESLVVNCESHETAQAEYEQLISAGVVPGEALLYGATILIELPDGLSDAERDALFDHGEAITENLFVANDESGVMLVCSTVAPTPEVAEEIAGQVSGYVSAPAAFRLLPPWEPGVTESMQLARRTVALLARREWMEETDVPEDYFQRVEAAQRRGNNDAIEALRDEIVVKNQAVRDAYLQTLRGREPGEIDLAVLDAYAQGCRSSGTQPNRSKSPPNSITSISTRENHRSRIGWRRSPIDSADRPKIRPRDPTRRAATGTASRTDSP